VQAGIKSISTPYHGVALPTEQHRRQVNSTGFTAKVQS
jgi:hypothetical protein